MLDSLRGLTFWPAISWIWTAGANFVFYYPLVMSVVWMCGACVFSRRYERNHPDPPVLSEHPLVSVLIPARNEQDSIRETVKGVLAQSYPN